MHLKSLTLKGFKSFPDRTRLEFSPGISVVVGPNGSGKSNVTDAVLWAMGEQSPLAIRGQSMQDVIFAGGRGVQARAQAEVEVVLDNADASVDLPVSEISILRRLDRSGDGEYRINGAKCRLVDVLEILSDTGLGKEMHSVISQGRVESLVTSKPKDRRLLIEEAAGLGKHRKRRRRAQLKLTRTQENLDRALDIEREARTRLRPLKRQAEAAELHDRLERQITEARWVLAGEALRAARAELHAAATAAQEARAARQASEEALQAVLVRRGVAEAGLAARAEQRERIASACFAARSALDRVSSRLESARATAVDLERRIPRRAERLAELERALAEDTVGAEGADRVTAIEQALEVLKADAAERRAREIAGLESVHRSAAERMAKAVAAASEASTASVAAETAVEQTKNARRETERTADLARRESARLGSELASLNHELRRHAAAPGGAAALADRLDVEAGAELAVAAALDGRLGAALAATTAEAHTLLDRARNDGGIVLLPAPRATSDASVAIGPPAPGAVPLRPLVRAADDDSGALADRLLGGVWLVESFDGIDPAFAGTAVTRSGRVWRAGEHELRQTVAGGEDRVLEKRNRRASLVGETEQAAEAERVARANVSAADAAFKRAQVTHDAAERAARDAQRARRDAEDSERGAQKRLERRKRATDDGPAAVERVKLEAELAAERRLAERLARERAERTQRLEYEQRRQQTDQELAPLATRLVQALSELESALREKHQQLEQDRVADRGEDEKLNAELRACGKAEAEAQRALAGQADAVTSSEVAAQRARDRSAEASEQLHKLSQTLGLEPDLPTEPMEQEERQKLLGRIEKLERRRSQLGPVNPLAAQELAEALSHVEELEAQRADMENALRELKQLIRDTDKRIQESFEQTFEAAAQGFEEVAAQLFPGGRGRLRLVKEDTGPRPVIGGQKVEDDEESEANAAERAEAAADAEAEAEGNGPGDDIGVEIEITPAGKATKRLSLLSGGEKSLTALAFLFAVFLARPCPFYILDEVEAALDDLNIDRFLKVLRRYADRAQFIVVTHQKRTMEAADCLYGVSMAGNGVSKVISRKLPHAVEDPGEEAA